MLLNPEKTRSAKNLHFTYFLNTTLISVVYALLLTSLIAGVIWTAFASGQSQVAERRVMEEQYKLRNSYLPDFKHAVDAALHGASANHWRSVERVRLLIAPAARLQVSNNHGVLWDSHPAQPLDRRWEDIGANYPPIMVADSSARVAVFYPRPPSVAGDFLEDVVFTSQLVTTGVGAIGTDRHIRVESILSVSKWVFLIILGILFAWRINKIIDKNKQKSLQDRVNSMSAECEKLESDLGAALASIESREDSLRSLKEEVTKMKEEMQLFESILVEEESQHHAMLSALREEILRKERLHRELEDALQEESTKVQHLKDEFKEKEDKLECARQDLLNEQKRFDAEAESSVDLILDLWPNIEWHREARKGASELYRVRSKNEKLACSKILAAVTLGGWSGASGVTFDRLNNIRLQHVYHNGGTSKVKVFFYYDTDKNTAYMLDVGPCNNKHTSNEFNEKLHQRLKAMKGQR